MTSPSASRNDAEGPFYAEAAKPTAKRGYVVWGVWRRDGSGNAWLCECNGPETAKQIASALNALATRSESKATWISVEDRLPEPEKIGQKVADFVPVLFFTDAEDGKAVCAGRYMPNEKRRAWVSLQGSPYRRDEVTHWMPIPKEPR